MSALGAESELWEQIQGDDMEQLIGPHVHMNGTSREELLAGNIAALDALDAAMKALAAINPNGRDYYIQPEGRFALAQAQHRRRAVALDAVKAEIERLAESIV